MAYPNGSGPSKSTARKAAQMDEGELKSIISNELNQALGADGGKLSQDRQKNLAYYNGEPFGNEIDGRSQVISRNVLEAVEWVLPALLRIFTASDKICEFEPYRPGEEPQAQQATEYINYIITRDNPGFMILADWFKDSLISKVGYIQVYWDETRTYTNNIYTGLSDLEYETLTQSDDVEIIEETAYPNPDPGLTWFTEDDPEPQVPQLHDVTVRVSQQEGRVRIESIAPEEILISRRAPSTVLDGKHFVCRRTLKRVTDLREMGFDEELIDRAKGLDEPEYNSERISRFFQEDDWPGGDQRLDEAMREVWIDEAYLPVDWDGDGIAELRRVISAGNGSIIFENEPIDEVPIIAICPIPMPHKHVGMALADLVTDLQEVKSALWRMTLDSLYLSIAPRVMIAEMAATDETYDDLLTVRPGGIIRVADIQGIQPLTVPFVGQAAMPVLDYIDNTQEIRTGVSRRNQGLSPDDLNKTAAGTSMIQQAAAQRIELIARIFAEMGIKVLAQRILGLVIRHQQEARVIRLTGRQWVPMDPRQWRSSMDINVNVGLGTGNKDQMLGHLTQLLQIQQQMVAAQKGIAGPLVTAENIYDVAKKLTENLGFKEDFFTDPRTVPPQPPGPPQPNPEMLKAQASVQADQMRTQADIQADRQKAQWQMELEQARAQHSMQLEAMRAQHAMDLERSRDAAKAALEMARLQRAPNVMGQAVQGMGPQSLG